MQSKLRPATATLMVVIFLNGAVADSAQAEPVRQCQFKVDIALMCQVGEIAADIYRNFGANAEQINEPYNKRIIHEGGCIIINGAQRMQSIQRLGSVRIAEPDNSTIRALWVDMVLGTQHYTGWIADNYLQGTCPRSLMGLDVPTNTDQIQCEDDAFKSLISKAVQSPDSISNRDFNAAQERGKCRAVIPETGH